MIREAAVAHVVFTPKKQHPVEVRAAEEAHLVHWFGAPVKALVRAREAYAQLTR